MTFSTNTSTQWAALNSRMNRGSLRTTGQRIEGGCILLTAHQSSLAMPRSLQHLINALLLQASVAVGIPEGSKYSCSPLEIPTSLEVANQNFSTLRADWEFSGYLPRHTSAYSLLTTFGPTFVSLRGARPHPPGPKALLRMRRYLISGRYISPSAWQFSIQP